MKKVFVTVSLFLLIAGCKKSIDKIKENAVVSAMTDGQWGITKFVNNGTNITFEFTNFKFQFYSNNTVDAIKSGTLEKTGTWNGDASRMTIDSNFPNSIFPLNLINGTWQIDNNSWTFVVASQKSGADTMSMRLEKL
ncbi:MAG: hypothetical protein ACSLE0_21435 [Chitinophagaceae bacterium]